MSFFSHANTDWKQRCVLVAALCLLGAWGGLRWALQDQDTTKPDAAGDSEAELVPEPAPADGESRWSDAAGMARRPLRGRIAGRLGVRTVEAVQAHALGEGREGARFLVRTGGKFPWVVWEQEFRADGSSDLLREVAYVADHVLVKAAEGEPEVDFRTKMRNLGLSVRDRMGALDVYRVAITGSPRLGAVEEAVALLRGASLVAEPDYLVFTAEEIGATRVVEPRGADGRLWDPVANEWAEALGRGRGIGGYSSQALREMEAKILDENPEGSRLLTFEILDGTTAEFRPEMRVQNFVVRAASDEGTVYVENSTSPLTPNNGSAHLRVISSLGGVEFRHQDGLPFDAHRVDLAEYSTVLHGSHSIHFQGEREDGSIVEQTFVTDGVIDGDGPLEDFETFDFDPAFHDLVDLVTTDPPFVLDNLLVTLKGQETPPVPPPVAPVIYRVDWNNAPHRVGALSAVNGRYAPSTLSSGFPTVRESMGALMDQPLELIAGEFPFTSGQIQFYTVDTSRHYVLEFDFCKIEDEEFRVNIQGEPTGVMNFRFMDVIHMFYSGGDTGSSFGTHAYDPFVVNHVRIEIDLNDLNLAMALNGTELFSGPIQPIFSEIHSIGLSLREENANGGTAVDNVVISAFGGAPFSDEPHLNLVPVTKLHFPDTVHGASARRTLRIYNSGTRDLTIFDLSENSGDFEVGELATSTIIPGGRLDVEITFRPTRTGDIEGELTLLSNDPDDGERTLFLEGRGFGTPVVALDPNDLDVTMLSGVLGEETFRIENLGTDTLSWRLVEQEEDPVIPPLVTPNDSEYGYQWNLLAGNMAGMEAARAWNYSTGGAQVAVAVIDSGLQLDHPELSANLLRNAAEVPGNGIDDDGNGYPDDVVGWDFFDSDAVPDDSNGHGTHVAGTIGASSDNGGGIAGVVWDSPILPIRFLNENGAGYTSDAILAVDYARARGVRIINASWGGGGDSELLEASIETFCRINNGLFVAAAGNDATSNDDIPQFPAYYNVDRLVAVAASDRSDELADFSNWGAESVDLAAPGVEILSTFTNGRYAFASGTSMAAPHVSGTLAMLMDRNPNLSADDLKGFLLDWVDLSPGLNGRVLSDGRANAYRSITRIPDSWIRPAPSQGEVPPGGFQTVVLALDCTQLIEGRYEASLYFQTNDPDQSNISLPVTLNVVAPNELNTWSAETFAESNMLFNAASDGLWSDAADPDQDGVPNLIEYVLARSPLSAESVAPLALSVDSSDQVELTFRTRALSGGAEHVIVWTDNLASGVWRTDGVSAEPIEENEETGTILWRVTFDPGGALPQQVFFRLQAARGN